MRDILEEFVEDNRNKNTAKNHKTALRRFDSWLPDDKDLDEVTKNDLKNWVRSMRDDISDGSLASYYYSVSTFYSWLVEWGEWHEIDIEEDDNSFEHVELTYLGVDPNGPTRQMQETKREETYRALSRDQVHALIENVPAPETRNELVVRMLYQTGVRVGELVSIELGDIDREYRQIRIDSKKTDGYRTVFYQESLDTLLDIYLEAGYRDRSMYSESSPYLFVTRESETLSKNRVGKIVKQAAENAGIQDEAFTYRPGGHESDCSYATVTPHVLRHTFAHHAIHEGTNSVDLVTLSKQLGHERIETTKMYLQGGLEQRRNKMHRAGPGFGSNEL